MTTRILVSWVGRQDLVAARTNNLEEEDAPICRRDLCGGPCPPRRPQNEAPAVRTGDPAQPGDVFDGDGLDVARRTLHC